MRSIGRQRKRWIDDVEEDLTNMKIRSWKRLCNERADRRKIVEVAKTRTE